MHSNNKERLGYALIIVTAMLTLWVVVTRGPIPQDTSYHLFVDEREIWSIPNFWNVVTSIPFAIAGLLGVVKLSTPGKLKFLHENTAAYILLFVGTLLVSFGSAYYHLEPNNQTLIWDRAPMSIAFMALFSIVISEFLSVRSGKALLLPLILTGILSVVYWHFGENQGNGDLRFYAIVQFYPMIAIFIMLSCFRSSYTHVQAYWWLLLIYIIAKLFEYYDGEVFDALGFISGHSLKHLTAALGVFVLLASYQRRQRR